MKNNKSYKIFINISWDAFLWLAGLVQGKFKAAEAFIASDMTAYGIANRKVENWTTTSDCGWFCKRTTQHSTMSQSSISWYVGTPGISIRPDA